MPSLLLSCKRCAAPIRPGPGAAAAATRALLLDASCPGCGKRALYEVPYGTANGG